MDNQSQKWYVIHTQTGAEEKARAGLESRMAATDLKKFVSEIVVPTEQVSEIRVAKSVLLHENSSSAISWSRWK